MKLSAGLKQNLISVLFMLSVAAVSTAQDAKPNLRGEPDNGSTLDAMVDVGGRRLHINCRGQGNPVVVMDAGRGNSSATWNLVQPEVAKFARVCVYDRAGLGSSEPDVQPRTTQQMVADLHALLTKAEIKSPYIMVGHSWGGMNVRLYASQYPRDVVGMVLVDSAHEKQGNRLEALMTPEQVKRSRQLISSNPEAVDIEKSRAQVAAAQWRSSFPLFVVTRGRAPAANPLNLSPEQRAKMELAWKEMQADLLRRSTNGNQIIAEKSGHDIQKEQPELVINSIREVIQIAASIPKNRELPAEERAKIKELCESYRSAWITNDQNAVLATLTEDAVLLPHHGHPPVAGRSEIKKFWWPVDMPPTTVTMFTMTTDEIKGSGDMGYVWGKFSLAFTYEDKGQKKSVSNGGTYIMIVRRQTDGPWLITHRMWDDPVPQVR